MPKKPGELIPIPTSAVGRTSMDASMAMVERAFYRGANENTARSDKKSLEIFGKFIGAKSFGDLASKFLSSGQGAANMKALEFKGWLQEQGKAPSTINRRLSALNKMVKAFRFAGVISWGLDVEYVAVETYRDTSGPGCDRFAEAMAELATKTDRASIRDRTILILLHDAALRRSELVSVDVEHYEADKPCIWVTAKKRTARVKTDLSPDMKEAIEQWLAVRGSHPGPLFVNFSSTGEGHRLSGRSVSRITNKYGVGSPHGLRHLAITEMGHASNGNVIETMKFARHKDPKTTMAYIDNLKKSDASASKILAEYRKGNKRV